MTHAYVGGNSNSIAGSGGAVSVTYSPVAGNGVWLTIGYDQSSARTITSVKNQSGTDIPYYEAGAGLQDDANYTGTRLVWCPNLPAGITAIVVSMATSAGFGVDVREFSGLSIAAPSGTDWYALLQATATTAADNVTSGNLTPASQPGLLFGAAVNVSGSGTAPTAGTGMTSRGAPAFAMGFYTGNWRVASKDITSTSAVAATFTNAGTSGNSHQTLAAFVPDALPPATLSSPTSSTVTDTTATIGSTSNTAGGTLFWAVTSSASQPTNAQIKAGSGGTIVTAGSGTAVSGANTANVTGRTASTQYWYWFVQNNGSDSNVVGSTFTTTAPAPSVTSVSSATPANGASLTITGTGFNATQSGGSVTIGGTTCTATSWSSTSIVVTVALGLNKFGVPLSVVVTNGVTGLSSAAYAGITGMTPQAGWAYINIVTPNATTANRVTFIADASSGDQATWDTVGGLVTMYDDVTFSAIPPAISFDAALWTSGAGYGASATQTLATSTLRPTADLVWI